MAVAHAIPNKMWTYQTPNDGFSKASQRFLDLNIKEPEQRFLDLNIKEPDDPMVPGPDCGPPKVRGPIKVPRNGPLPNPIYDPSDRYWGTVPRSTLPSRGPIRVDRNLDPVR